MTAGERADLPALAAGLVTVGAWGSAFVAIRAAGATFAPGSIALGRLLVSSAVLGAVALARREPLPPRRDVLPVAVYGVLWLGLYSLSLNAAERRVDAGTAAMLINTGPILIAVLAGVFLHEGFPGGLLAGCAVAFGGCVLIGAASADGGTRGGLGIALLALAALAYATAVVVQKAALARVSAFQVTWLGCAAATVACLPFAPALARQLAGAGAGAIGWTVYLGAVPTALGFATWSFALRRGSAGRTGSLNYLIPVVAILLGWAVLGEAPPALAAAGGALCLGGVYLARRPHVMFRPSPFVVSTTRSNEEVRQMRYVLLFCGTADDQRAFESLTPEALGERYAEVGRWFGENGSRIRGSNQLQPRETATTVRHGDGGPVVTDGPFIEGNELIGGYAEVEVDDLDEALAMARTWPGGGAVEIRPVFVRGGG